ncbi:UvrD/REP helicase N-terminal domain-containing protein [Flavobacterium sp. 270]|nr:UvrD/REP helicase N-terminal domain-containing protein [Flavobacterium sp. 270]
MTRFIISPLQLNMPVKMEIEKFITQAKKIFISGSFDEERRDFIKNLETCDLLAVPGSGKTTALIAKLYCIAQNMPFEDGSGILVLAHTNTAVEEIEKKIKKHCPQLFQYPNYVGTIQSFVNRYVANQACFEQYGSYITKNEDELSNEKVAREIFYNKSSKIYAILSRYLKESRNTLTEVFLGKYGIADKKQQLVKFRSLEFIDKNDSLLNIQKNYDRITSSLLTQTERKILFDFNNTLKGYEPSLTEIIELVKRIEYNEEDCCFYSDIFPKTWKKRLVFSSPSGAELKTIYDELRKQGYFKYIDSFDLSLKFILSNTDLKNILQKRFKYVFVDEMQDLEINQINIVDQIFFGKESPTVIQRIGDKNQAIYSSGRKVKQTCDWITREEAEAESYVDLRIQNSLRLSSKTADLVDKFVLQRPENYKVTGLFKDSDLNPHLILINRDTTGKEIKSKFIELIKKHQLNNCDKNIENGFKIISWVTDKEEDNSELYLKKLFSEYTKESRVRKEDFNCLKKYIYHFDAGALTLGAARASILNSLTRILDLEYIRDGRGRKFTKSTLMQFLKNQGDEYYNDFKAKLFSWAFDATVNGKKEEVFQDLKIFIKGPDFIGLRWSAEEEDFIACSISRSEEFVDSVNFEQEENPAVSVSSNEEINIDLQSIHAVKGQTHCATMYIESSYFKYETSKLRVVARVGTKTRPEEILPNPLFNQYHNYRSDGDARAKEALKMMYVGFSRPTHLLCFVVLEENIKDYLDMLCHTKGGIWEIDKALLVT